jgi:hypothetical protein
MGTVHLTNGHHGLYIRGNQTDVVARPRITLDRELMARPILNREDEPYLSPVHDVVRAALWGLMELSGFDAAVSFRVVEKTDGFHIALPHRVWGEITLGTPDNVIVGFSHDTRYENKPFGRNLLEWLEDGYTAGESSMEEYERFCLRWSYSEKWLTFFEGRIRREVDIIRSRAEKLRAEAQVMSDRAAEIETVFGYRTH